MIKHPALKSFFYFLPVLLWVSLAFPAAHLFFEHVDLKPQVEPHFFFADSDPQYKHDLEIKKILPEPEQIIISAKGNLDSAIYQEKIRKMSYDLLGLPPVYAVQSLALGPEKASDALKSPLWQRLLIADNREASLFILYSKNVLPQEMYPQIETIVSHYNAPDFELVISGAPYIVDLIRRLLFEDLKTFSLAAFFVFSIVILLIFRSLRVLLGTLLACAYACAATLFLTHWLAIRIGPLTANLTTIVFALTLSHITYLTFNWKHALENKETIPRHPVWHAIHDTLRPSFWSMFTTLLGFSTLIFVEATPFRLLGIAGVLGTVIALVTAYTVFPWFLAWKTPAPHRIPGAKPKSQWIKNFLSERHRFLTFAIFLTIIGATFGIPKIERDPHLLSYFKEGTPLRTGLNYIDEHWGSSPLKIVIQDEDGNPFNSEQTHKKMAELQRTLEKFPPVGNMISLPLILTEAKSRNRLSFMVNVNRILDELAKPENGNITEQFVTPARDKSLLLFRMKSLDRKQPRQEIIDHIKTIIWAKGFIPMMTGGIYMLQGEVAHIVITSLLTGLGALVLLFFLMGLSLSRSLHVAGVMVLSLIIIPLWLLGILGYLKVPLDVISAPATNLAMAMGVDAMIHLLIMVRRYHRNNIVDWEGWIEARTRLWKPILTSTALICTGFAIFTLSYFPPTQRFGISVILGTMMAPIAALIILPTLAGTSSAKNE